MALAIHSKCASMGTLGKTTGPKVPASRSLLDDLNFWNSRARVTNTVVAAVSKAAAGE